MPLQNLPSLSSLCIASKHYIPPELWPVVARGIATSLGDHPRIPNDDDVFLVRVKAAADTLISMCVGVMGKASLEHMKSMCELEGWYRLCVAAGFVPKMSAADLVNEEDVAAQAMQLKIPSGMLSWRKHYEACVRMIDDIARVHRDEEPSNARGWMLGSRLFGGAGYDEYQLRSWKWGSFALVRAAIQVNTFALTHATPELRANKALALAAVHLDQYALRSFDPALRGDVDVMLAAVHHDGMLLQEATTAIKGNMKVVLAAVTQAGAAIMYADTASLTDEEYKKVALAAVLQNPHATMLLEPGFAPMRRDLRDDPSVMRAARLGHRRLAATKAATATAKAAPETA